MFRKQKLAPDLEPQPLTPTERAEILLNQSGEQLGRLLKILANGNISEVETSLGFILVTPANPRTDPLIIAETDINALRERQAEGSMQRVWLARDMGQYIFSAWLDSVPVRSYTVERESTVPTAILEDSLEGPVINKTAVETVEEVDGSNPGAATTLARLEDIMQTITQASVTKFPAADHVA